MKKMRTNHSSRVYLTATTLLSLNSLAFATDYAAGFNMSANASHNDNIRLVQRDKTAVRKFSASPTLTLSATTETSELRLDSTFDFNRYDENQYNSDDQSVRLVLSRQFETSLIDFNAGYINNSTTTSELLTSGRIGIKAERAEQYQLSPRWLHNINENNLFQLQASYIFQDYNSDSYTGYKNIGAQASWIYKINERVSWVTAATYSDYQSDDVSVDVPRGVIFGVPVGTFGEQNYATRTKNKGVNIGVDYKWSEQASLEARLGRSKSSTIYPVKDPENICDQLAAEGFTEEIYEAFKALTFCNPLPSSDAHSSTADIIWKWQNERHQIAFSGTKETQPTSNGYAVDAIQIGSNWDYRLTELDELSAAITLVRNRAIDDKSELQNASNADRDYGVGTLAYKRQLSEYWSLRASYQFAKQKYTEIDYEASSNIWTLSINYRPQPWHWAR